MARLHSGFTTRASCLVAAGGTALLCGVVLGVVDLVRAGILVVALPISAAVLVNRSRVQIANRRSAEPPRIAAGEAVTIHLSITNRSLLRTGALLLEDQLPPGLSGQARFVVPGLAGRESRTVSYRIPGLSRGRYRAGPLHIRLTDPFKMVDITRSFAATSTFLVSPVVETLPTSEPPRSYDIGDNAGSHSIGAHGADDASTREYRTGDDLRKVHWRSTARTGTMMVRLEERPWQGQTTVLLDLREAAHRATGADPTADPRHLQSIEWAISAAASIGTHLMVAGRRVRLLDDPANPGGLQLDNPSRLADHLALVRGIPGSDLSPLSGSISSAARDSALIAVLGSLDTVSLRVLSDAHPRGSAAPAFALLLDTSTWSDMDDSLRAAAVDPRAVSLEAARRILTSAGWRAVIVRRGDAIAESWTSLLGLRSSGGRAEAVTR